MASNNIHIIQVNAYHIEHYGLSIIVVFEFMQSQKGTINHIKAQYGFECKANINSND